MIGDDNLHITAILQWNMNIASTFHLPVLNGHCKVPAIF